MFKKASLILLFLTASSPSANLEHFDSLFIQASAASYKYQHLLEPAREKIINAEQQAMPFLISKLSTRQPREYQALKDIFRKVKPDLASRYLLPEIEKKERRTYGTATELLGLAGGHSIAGKLYPDLQHDSVWVRIGAIRSLGNMQDSSAEKHLISQITHPDYRIRWQTAAALGKIGTASALEQLLKLTGDSLQVVRMTAFLYLKNNLAKLPVLKNISNRKPDDLILHRLNYLQDRTLYTDSARFTPIQWHFIKNMNN